MMKQVVAAGAALAFVLAPVAALAAPVMLTASLTGATETGGGDSDGSGTFSAEIDTDSGDFCYTLTGAGIDKPTMAHVHSGAAGADGPPVVTIDVASDICIAVEPAVLKPIIDNPTGFYINIHTAAFPKGAVRGQLQTK